MSEQVIGYSVCILIFIVLPFFGFIYRVKNEKQYIEWISKKYRHRFNRLEDPKTLLPEIKNELEECYRQMDTLRLELDILYSQKDLTENEICTLVDRLNNYGLAKNNRNRYFIEITVSFISGVLASVVASVLWLL